MIDTPVQPRSAATNQPPPIGMSDLTALMKWVDSGIYYGHDLRCRDASEWRRAELYDKGAQWLNESLAGYEGGGTAAQWVETYWGKDDPSYIPTPVFNEGVGARINESARLGRPNYRPTIRPRAETPDLKSREGGKLMKEQILHRLRDCHWDDRHSPLLYYHMPLYGGAWWKSEFVLRWDQTVTVPVTGGVQCPTCGLKLSSPTLDPAQLGKINGALSGNAMIAATGGQVKANVCPRCPDHPPMMPLKPTLQEAQGGARDELGRPLGVQQPMGDWELTVRSPYDMFPRNMGLDMQFGSIPEWTEVHVEHLDWISLRWPDKVGYVQPENAAALARYHPVAGAPDLLYSLLDHRMFENCARVKERHRLPWMEPVQEEQTGEWIMRLNRGRSVVVVGSQVMYDGPLLMDSANYPGETVPRVMVDYIPWEFQDGGRRLQGLSLWKTMFDPQDAANEIRSQTQSVRKRLAVPLYIALTTHHFTIQGMRGGIPGALAEIEPDPNAPTVLPQLINNTTIDEGVRHELEDAITAIERYAGYVEVEKGQPPPNVSAGNAIAFLKGAAGERREPRLARIRGSLARGWSHGAALMAHMYLEPRAMRYEDDDGEERWRYVKGTEFHKQTDVDIDAEPDFDSAAKQVEVVRDLIQLHVIDPTTLTPQKQRRLAKMLDAPEELFEDDDLQDKGAEREWIEYKDQKITPRIDPGVDDDSTHYQKHGRACHSALFRELERKANWDSALAILGGTWFEDLQVVAMTPMPGMDLQTRIGQQWMAILHQALLAGRFQPGDPEAFKFVITWRAHTEAHRLSDELKQMRAAMQPVLAAPDAAATAAGNQPTAGAGPAPPPGAQVAPAGAGAAVH